MQAEAGILTNLPLWSKMTKPQSMFYKDAPFHKATKAVVWPVSTPLVTKLYGCKQSWRRRLHLSPDRPSSCSLQMLRRRRRRRRRRKGPFSPSPSFSHHPPSKSLKSKSTLVYFLASLKLLRQHSYWKKRFVPFEVGNGVWGQIGFADCAFSKSERF